MRKLGLVGSLVLACANDPAADESGGSSTSGASTSTATTVASTDNPTTTNNPTTTAMTDATTVDTGSSASDDTTASADSTGTTGGVPECPNVDVSDPQLYEFELDPLALDPTVVNDIELQYAHLDTRVEPLGTLVFFLSGFTNTPSSWRDHGRQIASWGFHVVEPHYNNHWDCGGMGGTCGTDSRWEALVGEDVSSLIDQSRADSAEGRVVTMLKYLDEMHPQGDWGCYLDEEDNLRYDRVIIAGISHGAASSGLFASRRPFTRVVMHSGGWWEVPDDPMTPIDLWYGLAHSGDEQYDGILSSWEGAGMVGMPTSIDDMMPPYGDAHQLVTSVPNGYPHCSTCVSGDSPMNENGYVFDPAWRHMYGAPQLE
ncbi:MAG TPA: hypothetical protein VG755_25990 [Nannocystaceae bacterium]|nr:hypothetical protein [Nannocystaceae bacterium]